MKVASGHSAGAIIDFITLFGKAPKKKNAKINVVLDYATALGEPRRPTRVASVLTSWLL